MRVSNSYLKMANVKLQSSDGEVFEVEADVAKVSTTIKNMLDGEREYPN